MQIRAIKTFNGRHGLVRSGLVITVDDRYGRQLIGSGLAIAYNPDAIEPRVARNPGPSRNADLGGPRSTKDDEGNASDDDSAGSSGPQNGEGTGSQPDPESGETGNSRAGRRGGGRARQSSSRQAGRRSRKTT